MKNRGLGKGLSALISEQKIHNSLDSSAGITNLDVRLIEAGKFQPRKIFNQEAIEDLADSIMRHGIIQPIVVRKLPHSPNYQIIAGERRWRAATIAGLIEIPVIIKDLEDFALAEQAIIENIQRENLNPMEEAEAYLELMDTHEYSQEELAKAVGKKRSHIANMLRLTSLPEIVKTHILNSKLTFSHAKVIAAHEDAEEIAEEIIAKNLNVRQTEHLLKNWKKASATKSPNNPKAKSYDDDDDFAAIADSLTERLGLKITIDNIGSKGKITIHYNNYEQLDLIAEKLAAGNKS